MQAATDEQVLDLARQATPNARVGGYGNFVTLLARTGAKRPSIILVRQQHCAPPEQVAALLLANFDPVTGDLAAGAIVVVTDVDVRIRRCRFHRQPDRHEATSRASASGSASHM